MASNARVRGHATTTAGMNWTEMRMADPLLQEPGGHNVDVTGGARKRARAAPTEAMDVSVDTNTRRVVGRRVATRTAALALLALLALPAASAVGACRVQPLTIPGKARDPREMPGSTSGRSPDVEPAVASKRVAAKEPPLTLVAEDGSRCAVTESKYNNARIGDTVFCAWRTSDRAP